jgi:hypothetical protein
MFDTTTSYNSNYLRSPTEVEGNNTQVGKIAHNRKVIRYAKKHNITEEEAIKRLYK